MKREAEIRIRNLIENPNCSVVIIEGARQVGKSYTVDNVLTKFDRPVFGFDLEKNIQLRRRIDATEDFEDFITLMKDRYGLKENSVLFFDEAQESKKLASYVKSFKEDLPSIQLVLTGSSMNRFFPKDIRIPVGRYRTLCLFGFNFTEFIEYIKG